MNKENSAQQTFQQEIANIEVTIAALEAQRTVLGDLVVETALGLLRERLATLVSPQQAPDERKRVTVLFADVKGYTAMSENLDPEDVAMIMNRLFEGVTAEIHRYGGTVDKYAGDAVMALFGAPRALENHEEMALRASLAMQKVIKTFSANLEKERGFTLQMRIGLNTGEVLAGLVGGLQVRSYTVMGDTVNLAARLEAACPPGRVMLSAATATPLLPIFNFEPPQQISVKGKTNLIDTYIAVGERSERGQVRGLAGLKSPMIGRKEEFAALQQTFARLVAERTWQATAVVGEAGIGKSRIYRELWAWIQQTYPTTQLLKGRCYTHTRTTPYYFVAEIVRQLFQIRPEAEPETAVLQLEEGLQVLNPTITEAEFNFQFGSLASVLGLTLKDDPLAGLDPEQRRDRTFLSLERLFKAVSRENPLLIVIDDLHWADAISIAFLENLIQLMSRNLFAGHPAMFLILSRPAENPRSPYGRILAYLEKAPHNIFALTALSDAQSEQLINELLDQNIPAELLNLIYQRAQGNPLYVEEVLRSFIEDGTLRRDEENQKWEIISDVAQVKIPPSVQDILAARLDRLPLEDKRITQHAAIIGRNFWQELLAKLLATDTVDDTLALLELRQMADRLNQSQIAEDWEWVFRHILIQEVAYTMVPKSARRQTHKEIAQSLEQRLGEQTPFLLPLIAYHFEEGEVPEKAILYLGMAAEQAASQFANEDAITYFSRALKLLVKIGEQAPLTTVQKEQKYRFLSGRSKIYHLTGQREQQAADLAQLQFLANELDNDAYRTAVSLSFANYHEALGNFAEAVTVAKDAVKYANNSGNLRQKVESLNAWGLGVLRQGHFDEARKLLNEARRLARQDENQLGEAVSLSNLGIVFYYLGDVEEARLHLEQSLALSQVVGDLRRQMACLNNLVGVYHALGDLAQAQKYSEEAAAISHNIGNRSTEATILNNLGGIHHALGNLETAQKLHEDALTLSQTVQDRQGESLGANNLGLVLYDRNDFAQARQYAEHALTITRDIGDRLGEGYALTALGLALEGLQLHTEALAAHESALEIRRELGQEATAVDNLGGLARIALATGRLQDACNFVDEALAWFNEHGADGAEYPLRVYITGADVYQAAANPTKAQEILQQAADLLDTKATLISDSRARKDFMKNVPLHQQLRQRLAQL